MRETATFDRASSALARRALLVTLSIGTVSSASGLMASTMGMVAAREFIFVACIFLFTLGALVTLLLFRNVPLQTIATATTSYYAIHMCVGVWISLYGNGQHLNLFIYLLWLFPILAFNKLVNQPAISKLLARTILVFPLLMILFLLPRWTKVLLPEQRVLLSIFCLTYICYALTLNIVTRYREKYIIEQQRAESLRVTAEVFESISDCFLSLDAEFRLIYLNDAACLELGVTRETALYDTLSHAAPRVFSEGIIQSFAEAYKDHVATLFEAQSKQNNLWYDFRCFPRIDSMSIYFRDITNRKNDESRIQRLAYYDVLTGLPNRQLFRDRLTEAIAGAPVRKSIGALLYIDLDDFKNLNDTMGHEVGDSLLQEVAARLSGCLQCGETIARIGGDEFGVMLEALGEDPEAATNSAALAAEKILALFSSDFVVGSYTSEIKVSVGATLFGVCEINQSETLDDLFKRADLAMYGAKTDSGNTVRFFDPAMQIEVETREALRADLRFALQRDEFTLDYQPQVGSDGIIYGSEALLRWYHPVRGRVSPGEFIPVAEATGLIIELGRWVLEAACLQLAAWSEHPSMEHLTLAVNVSVRQFLEPHFVQTVVTALRFSGANPNRLKLEITESSLMENVGDVIAKMNELRALGVSFSLDDFGTGYSSLSYLRHLPLDQLKIDRTFTAHILTDEKYASIARTIIVLGRSLGLSVIAEGVETEAQRVFLMEEGCHLFQGFLYGRGVSAAEFEEYFSVSKFSVRFPPMLNSAPN